MNVKERELTYINIIPHVHFLITSKGLILNPSTNFRQAVS